MNSGAKLCHFIRKMDKAMYHILVHNCRIFLSPLFTGRHRFLAELLVIEFKEIGVEHNGDTKKKFRINSGPSEYVVYIRTVAIKFAREPRHRAFLPAQFLLNQFTDDHSRVLPGHTRHPVRMRAHGRPSVLRRERMTGMMSKRESLFKLAVVLGFL